MSSNYINGYKFILGANLAWLDGQYDHDFGNNQIITGNIPTYNNPINKNNFRSYLQDMKNMGIQVVRLWVFERFEGLVFNNDGSINGVDSTLVGNLADACSVAADIGVKFYLCLMDTWGIWQNNIPQKQNWLSTINGLITTPEKTNSFLNNAVIPLLSDATIKNQIFAVDVLNEPEGIDRANTINDGQYPIDTQITWDQLVTFIKTCADSIKSKTHLSASCGFQNVSSVQNDPNGLSNHLDFFDFHRYLDTWDLPDYSSLGLNTPCIIGECGQGTKQWSDSIQLNATSAFLNNALSKGYAGCFPWCYNYKGFTDLASNYLSLINLDGSWRPVCSMISEFAQNSK